MSAEDDVYNGITGQPLLEVASELTLAMAEIITVGRTGERDEATVKVAAMLTSWVRRRPGGHP